MAPAVLGACSPDPGYDLEPAVEWTVCPDVAGYSEASWKNDSDSAKWLGYMWTHNCTFPFVGWDAETMIWLNDHPDALEND
jgi:hypothetical protein